MTELIPFAPHPVAGPPAAERLAGVLAAFWTTLESPDSRRAYREDWTRFAGYLATENVHPLTAGVEQIAAYMESMRLRGLKRSTRARALSVLREMYGAVYRAGLRADNPARELKLPRVQREPNTPWLTEAQLVALLRRYGESFVDRRNRLALLMLLGLGLRRSSVARARVDHVLCRSDGRRGIRVLAKGGKTADLLLPSWLAREVLDWIAFSGATGPLFPRMRRVSYDDVRPEMENAIRPSTVREIVKAAAKRAGIDEKEATPHAIRRSYVTIARQRGASLADLQAALMHSTTTTTELYDRAARTMNAAPGEIFQDLYDAASVGRSTSP